MITEKEAVVIAQDFLKSRSGCFIPVFEHVSQQHRFGDDYLVIFSYANRDGKKTDSSAGILVSKDGKEVGYPSL